MPTYTGGSEEKHMAQKIRRGKRKWYSINAPKLFDEQEIGQTLVYETESIVGKHVKVNLMTLTNNPKKQSMNVFFVVTDFKENKASTKTIGIEMQQASTRRLARRGRSKVADSFRARTKKGQIVRIKPVIMTRTLADGEVQRALRARCRELIKETLGKYSFDTVISDIANNRLQKYLKDQLSAVFPVRSADIRYLRYEKADSEEEADLEETEYAERPRREKTPKASTEGLASLKEGLEEALAAEKDEPETKKKKVAPAEDEDEDEE